MASSGQEKGTAAEAAAAPAIPAKDAAANADADAVAETKDGSTPAKMAPALANGPPEREATAKDYIRIFSYAKKWDYLLLVAAAIASIGAGTTLPLMNVVFGKLVGSFTGFAGPGPTTVEEVQALRSKFEQDVNKLSLFLLILFVARFALNYINKFAFRMIGIRISAAIRLHYLQRLFGQSIHVLDSMPSGAAAGTITSTANTLQLGISEKLGIFIEFSSLIVTALIIAFTYNWLLTLVVSSLILFIVICVSIILPFIIQFHSKMTKAETKASAVASEAFSSIRMVMACGAEQRVLSRYSEWVKKAQKAGQVTSPLIALQFGVVFFAVYGAFALAFWYGARMFNDKRVDNIGTIVIVLMSVMMMVFSLERISTPLIDASKAMVAAAQFFAVIDAPRPDTGSLEAPDVSATEDIVLSGVDFAYPSRPHVKVLDNLNITLEKGKVTAIVGPSGSGKSTIVGLIERWYTLQNEQHVISKTIQKDRMEEMEKKKKAKARKKELKRRKKAGEVVDETDADSTLAADADTGPAVELKGSIKTCGHDLSEIKLKWWRAQVGLVQQEPFLFNDTIFNNVAHGLVGSEFEDATDEKKKELVEEACKEAFADEFIDRLPDAYQTKVGDAGAKLSGGQRQRIAIARSIIKKPKILILDEATSAIDVRGERIVQAALDKVSKGRTTITIAHRLSTIKTADKICVMRKGRCVEEGTHDSLLQNEEGAYYGLVHAQQLALGDDADEDEEVREESIGEVLAREKSAARSEAESAKAPSKWVDKGLVSGFGTLLYEQKSRLPSYILTVFFAMSAAAAIPVQAYLFAKILIIFNLEGDALLRESSFWALMWFVCALGVGLSYFFLGFISTHLQHYICATYRMEYFENILYQKANFFDEDDHAAGPLTACVTGDPKQLEQLLGMNMGMVYTSFFSLLGGIAIAFAFGWKLALVALCVTIPLGFGAGYYRIKYEIEFEKMYAAVFAESSSWASESIGAFRTVCSLTLEDVICTRYEELLRQHVLEAYKSARWRTFIFALADSMALGCQALIFWYGGRLIASGEYDVVNFFICYMAVIQGAEAAGNGLSFGPNAAQAAAASNRILKMRETRNKDLSAAGETVPDTAGGVKIELEDVHFKYPTRNVSIFRGLNITIEKGQFAALVGASGSGKTSIVSLLERFYDPSKGRILFNGKDVADVNVYEYRKLLSLVAQEASLFQGSFRDNILLGVDPTTVSEERLHEACRDASIHDFIVSLPDGYNTDVGSKGVSLSGGQRQRLAIARALVRDPSVLLLDEATSSLDSETEKQIQATFERVAQGRTTVAVAHRLSTIQRADVIYVLGEGKVLEKGNHAELLKKRGVYWHMCHSQALDR